MEKPAANYLDMPYRTTTLLMGPLVLAPDVESPFPISSSTSFDVASDKERDELRALFDERVSFFGSGPASSEYFESDWTGSLDESGHREIRSQPLPPGQSRYYVLRSGGPTMQPHQHRHHDWYQVSRIREPLLTPAITRTEAPEGEFGTSWGVAPSLAAETNLIPVEPSVVITRKRLEDLAMDLERASVLDEERHGRIINSLKIFSDTFRIDRSHALHTLGFFIAIEALIAHKPDAKDPIDSIGRQLRRAVPLLLRRGNRLEQFTTDDMALDTLLKRLYEYRSAIAHGEPMDRALPPAIRQRYNPYQLTKKIRALTQAVMCQALTEPDLAIDLSGPIR
ncbi:MAG: hypothetical protein ACR2QO_13635 [Acidimicrobiales bacterium]